VSGIPDFFPMPSSYLFLNGLRLHYLHWNLENGLRPIVALHGLASNARIWELTAPFLTEHGYRVYAPDQRGHGLTDKPEGDYGFDTFRGDLLAFLDACQLERPILVGHSWGALVALDFAAHYPFGPRAPAGVILVDGGVIQLDDEPGATWEQVRERLTPPRLAGMPLEGFLRRLADWANPLGQDEQAIQIILANFEIAEDESITPHLSFEHHMQIVRAMWEFKTFRQLMLVQCQVEAILALPPDELSTREEEFLSLKKRGADRALEVQPRLRVHWLENALHDIPIHRPGELANLILNFVRLAP
jgi:pimeloyl-ACP methyl ester carboxylesterase